MHGYGPPCSVSVDKRQCVLSRKRRVFRMYDAVRAYVRRALAAIIAADDGGIAQNTQHGLAGFEDPEFQLAGGEFVEKLLACFACAVSLCRDETGVENLSKRGHVR